MKKLAYIIFSIFFLNTLTVHAQNWIERAKIVASDRQALDRFTFGPGSVDNWGDYAVVGASHDHHSGSMNVGSAYIYKKGSTTCNWYEIQKITANQVKNFDYYGRSVAIYDDVVVIGAYMEDEDENESNSMQNAGSVYIYRRTAPNSWTFEQKIVASDREPDDHFGVSVDVYDNKIIVGAYRNNESGFNQSGAAYIFRYNTGSMQWVEDQKLTQTVKNNLDNFGASVAIWDNYAIIGALNEDENALNLATINNAGSAYIFEETTPGNWTQIDKLTAPANDRGISEHFGNAVDIHNNVIAIGCRADDHGALITDPLMNQSGSAYIYRRVGSSWGYESKIVAPDRAVDDFFGYDVSVYNDHVVIGSYNEDEDVSLSNSLPNAGSAYISEYSTGTASWGQAQKIVSSDRQSEDWFGGATSLHEDIAFIGASKEDHNTLGTFFASNAGSAYIFELETQIVADLPSLSASNTVICPAGASVDLSLTGNLNDADNWQWYTGGCTGTALGMGPAITVFPTTTTTYYANGVGACISDGPCASITITVLPSNWHQSSMNTQASGDGMEDVITDASGNVYVTGIFDTETTLDGGSNPSVTMFHAQGLSAFVAKYSECGDLLWADYAVGGDFSHGKSITLDQTNGIVYIAGNASQNSTVAVEFNSTGALALNSSTGSSSFVAAFDMQTGQAMYVDKLKLGALFQGIDGVTTHVNAITINESNGQIYVGGAYQVGAGFLQAFVQKYAPFSGGIGPIFYEINGIGTNSHSEVNDLDFYEGSSPGRLAVIGDYRYNVQFIGLTGGTTLSNFNMQGFFILCEDPGTGFNSILLNSSNGGGHTTGEGIAFDDNTGKVFLTGDYTKNMINPYGLGLTPLNTSLAVDATYLIGYDLGSSTGWAYDLQTGNGSSGGTAVSALNGKVYFTGGFSDDLVLSSGPPVLPYIGVSNSAAYILSYSDIGAFNWGNVTTHTGVSAHYPNSIAVDDDDHAFVCGSYLGNMNYFNTSGSLALTSSGTGANSFILRAEKSTGQLRLTKKPEEKNPIEQASSDILLYPNPNNGQFTIELQESDQPTQVSILNMQGQKVWEQQMSGTLNEVVLDELTPGLYLISFNTAGQQEIKKLIVK